MAKIKIQKKDIWIDMTPMSDVMTLLLCFFMLTSTFLTPEPVQVTAPNSVSEPEDSRAGRSEHPGNPRGSCLLRYGKQEQHAGDAGHHDRQVRCSAQPHSG